MKNISLVLFSLILLLSYSKYAISAPGSTGSYNSSPFIVNTGDRSYLKEFTFEAWIRPANIQSSQTVFSASDNIRGSLHYRINSENSGIKVFFTSGPRDAINIGCANIAENVWQHLSVVISQNETACYLNGKKTMSYRGYSPLPPLSSSVSFGSDTEGKYIFQGYMDDIRISKTSRNISQLWELGYYKAPPKADESTVFLYDFETVVTPTPTSKPQNKFPFPLIPLKPLKKSF